jgi:hypothetical protein
MSSPTMIEQRLDQLDQESAVPLLSDHDSSNWINSASFAALKSSSSSSGGASSCPSTASSPSPSTGRNLKRAVLRQVLLLLVITGFFAQTFLWLRWESEQEQYSKRAEVELTNEYYLNDSGSNSTVPIHFGRLLQQLQVKVDWINEAPSKVSGWVEPVACEIPLQVHPFDPSIAKYLKAAKPIQCPVKKEYAVQNDTSSEVRAVTKMIENDGVICMWNTIEPIFLGNQTLKYRNANWQRFDNDVVNMNKLNLTNIHVLCKHNWVFETYSQFFEWPVLPDDDRRQKALIKSSDRSVASVDRSSRQGNGVNDEEELELAKQQLQQPQTVQLNETGSDGLSANDPIPSTCPASPNVLLLMVESLSRLNYLRYMNRTRDVLASWPGVVRPLDGVFKLGDNSYPNIYPLLTGRPAGELKYSDDKTHSQLAFQSLLWKQFERMRGFYHAHYEDMPYWGTFQAHGALGMPSRPSDVHPREYFCALDNLHTKGAITGNCGSTSYLCHRGETQFGLSLRSGERFMRHAISQNKSFFAFIDPCKYTLQDAAILTRFGSSFIRVLSCSCVRKQPN